jgi:hypothetical protein
MNLLTGGLLVRIQPEEPFSLENLSTRPRPRADCDVDCDITRFAWRRGSVDTRVASDGAGVVVDDGSSAAAA